MALRVYVDTSVFGGCFDEEFAEPSRRLFDAFRRRELIPVISDAVFEELDLAPEEVRSLLAEMITLIERVPRSDEIVELRDAYLEARIVGASCAYDAEHIAAATIARADLVVSWNFKHVVHYDKIAGFNGINLLAGYPQLRIHAPPEIV